MGGGGGVGCGMWGQVGGGGGVGMWGGVGTLQCGVGTCGGYVGRWGEGG